MSQVISLKAASGDRVLALGAAIDEFLADGDFMASTVVVYERTLEALREDLGADIDAFTVTRTQLEAHLRARYGDLAPATYNRNLATIGSFFSWVVDRDDLPVSPAAKIKRRKERVTRIQERQDQAAPIEGLRALWRDTRHRLRDRAFWALGYSTAARADELLGLDVEYVDLPNRQGQIIGKGGDAQSIFWDSEAARLLARLIAGRTRGPVFLSDKAPSPARVPAAADIDPDTGRARLSYRRAEEIFKEASGGRTLHKLRHSRLTHLAEAGEDVTMMKAKSRHRSLRSLERYVNPSNRAVAELTARHDPNRRRP
ncbi:MAG TPA: tyrosine-type recombinase/integrase [Acidimicrobiales bacterium]|jgi:integrase/recombinase XerC/integrase/recombinase XerD